IVRIGLSPRSHLGSSGRRREPAKSIIGSHPMSNSYAPQRRLLLALQHEGAQEESALVAPALPSSGEEADRQAALSVPEAVRAMGEPLEPFFEACGGRRTIALSVWRPDRESPAKTYVFEQPFVLIGRCPESDLSLAHGKIGFRHLYLQLLQGRWRFVILASDEKASRAENGRT